MAYFPTRIGIIEFDEDANLGYRFAVKPRNVTFAMQMLSLSDVCNSLRIDSIHFFS